MKCPKLSAGAAVVLAALVLAQLKVSAGEPDAPKPTDPRLKAAQFTKEGIEQAEKDLSKAAERDLATALTKLEEAVSGMEAGRLQDEKKALEAFRGVVPELRKVAKELLAKEADYKTHLGRYREALKLSPAAFAQAAEVFEQRGKEEPVPEFKEKYQKLASSMRQLSATMENRARDLEPEEREVAEAYKFVASAEKFLGSFQEWLDTYPDLSSGIEREKRIEAIRDFLKQFRRLDGAFDKFTKKLQSQAVSVDLRSRHGERLAKEERAKKDAEEGVTFAPIVKVVDLYEPPAPAVPTKRSQLGVIGAGRDRGLTVGQTFTVLDTDGRIVTSGTVFSVDATQASVRFDGNADDGKTVRLKKAASANADTLARR
jgi:tetratricopeptide (TPR) repeat protein